MISPRWRSTCRKTPIACATNCGSRIPNISVWCGRRKRFETLHGLDAPPQRQGFLKLLFLYGRRAACDALILAAAEARDAAADWHAAFDLLRTAKEPRLPFSGDDLLARGIDTGKAVGEALRLWKRGGWRPAIRRSRTNSPNCWTMRC